MYDRTVVEDEPRWLTDAQQRAWRRLTAVSLTLPGAVEQQLQRDSGLSQFEYLVLAGLSEQPDRRIRMSRLALITNGSLSRLSHVVKRLERRGLVRRYPFEDDGRITMAELTEAGMATVVAAAPGHVATARHLVVDALSDEQMAQLSDIADVLLDRLGCPPDEQVCAGPG